MDVYAACTDLSLVERNACSRPSLVSELLVGSMPRPSLRREIDTSAVQPNSQAKLGQSDARSERSL